MFPNGTAFEYSFKQGRVTGFPLFNSLSLPSSSYKTAMNTSASLMTREYNDLHSLACSDEFQTSLLESASLCEINEADHNGWTPLMWAACNARNDIVEQLLDSGADTNLQNWQGETALYLAASCGNARGCELLVVAGADYSLHTCDGANPAHAAAAGGHVSVLQVFDNYGFNLNQVDFEGESPLFYAVRENQSAAVEFLASSRKVSCLLCNEDGETALELAALSESMDIVQIITKHAASATASAVARESGLLAETRMHIIVEPTSASQNAMMEVATSVDASGFPVVTFVA